MTIATENLKGSPVKSKPDNNKLTNLKTFLDYIEQLIDDEKYDDWFVAYQPMFSVTLPFAYSVLVGTYTLKDYFEGGEQSPSYEWMFLFASRENGDTPNKFYHRLKAYNMTEGSVAFEWIRQVRYHQERLMVPIYNDDEGVLSDWFAKLADTLAIQVLS